MLDFAITYHVALDKITGECDFAITYHSALDKVTGDYDMNLQKFELNEEDWKIATNLHDVLKVSWPILV